MTPASKKTITEIRARPVTAKKFLQPGKSAHVPGSGARRQEHAATACCGVCNRWFRVRYSYSGRHLKFELTLVIVVRQLKTLLPGESKQHLMNSFFWNFRVFQAGLYDVTKKTMVNLKTST